MFKVSGWVSKDYGFKSGRSKGCNYKSSATLPLRLPKNGKKPMKLFSARSRDSSMTYFLEASL